MHRDRHHSVRLTARDGSSAALSDRMASFTEREQVVERRLARAGREVRQLKPEITDSRAIARHFPGLQRTGLA